MKKITKSIIALSAMIVQTQFYSQTCSPQVEQSGFIILEAENYCSKTDKTPTNGTQKLVHQWTLETSNSNFSGTGYMTNLPDEQCESCPEHNSPKNGSGPEMTYKIEVLTEGLFNIWPRGFSKGGESNGVHIQFDDNFVFNGPGTNMSGFRPHRQWIWENDSKPKAAKAQIFLTKGPHIMHVYGRDDGFSLDKIILANDLSFIPKDIEGVKNIIPPVTSPTTSNKINVKGQAKLWHKMTLEIEGPSAKETDRDNPFLNYKLTGIFTNGTQRFEVPGYFAADGSPVGGDGRYLCAERGNLDKRFRDRCGSRGCDAGHDTFDR